ncbi:glycosyltransferase family 2 protein [Alicyclobacillus fastidiosus]|uniref:glycosyltransferase family 2 protein n=1 Tax=Alicyclobacillus fastidiosus TaxID=392011 RepID=UPI0023E9F388|nr:glycosyltransferase family 2 protein [Alicyclobacillus fastidiosus]GMA66075.1 glycosyl transferase family 2 [Alicyclobacillus fastidiosus]
MFLVNGVFDVIYSVTQILTLVIALYQFAISIFGFRHRKEEIKHAPRKRFAIIIPAHNEERVVGPLIDSIKSQRYPQSLFDIHLIADNCTDHTVYVGEKHGSIVHERRDNEKIGKGYAIQWMIEKLKSYNKSYDAIVMFDADNLVHPDFLAIMNDKLSFGHKVIQGYLGIKNPFDTWVSVSLAISYWYDNRMWQSARSRLGLPCALGGTGLCINYALLQQIGWKATGLTEDLEFGVRCVEHGVIPVWAHDAKIYDEKPITFKASYYQRLRWQQGHFNCASRYIHSLVKGSVNERRFMKFDMAVYLFQPMRSLIVFAMSIMLFVFNLPFVNQTLSLHVYQIIPEPIWVWISAILFLEMPVALMLERVNWKAYVGLILVPIFLWTWGPVTLHAYFTKRNKKWYHTIHKRALRFDQVQDP